MFASLLATFLASAPVQAAKDPLEGVWRGTSLCQVKPSPCHDENVVYHIAKAPEGLGYRITMNKIVNGAEQEMGTVDARFLARTQTLSAVTRDRQGRPGVWSFQLVGNRLSGQLVIEEGQVYRRIDVSR